MEDTQDIIEQFNLVYVHDSNLPIFRVGKKNAFKYTLNGIELRQKNHLKRIEELVIPPAWQEVMITDLPNGHLQATGRDARFRKQYRYHAKWSKIRNQTKFNRMLSFGQQLPKIRKQVDEDLNKDGWHKKKVVALIVRLMEETHIRIGNVQYAKRNKTYGLSTLRKKHVNIFKDKLRFEFVGKKGKAHKVSLNNKKLVKLVSECEEIPGWELFKYYGPMGAKKTVDSTMVNDYIHSIFGSRFSAKDFRTWAASLIFFDTLYDFGVTPDERQQQRYILNAYDSASRELGNTRNVCRKYYVHPLIEKVYLNGQIINYFKMVDEETDDDYGRTASEKGLLALLEDLHQPHWT